MTNVAPDISDLNLYSLSTKKLSFCTIKYILKTVHLQWKQSLT